MEQEFRLKYTDENNLKIEEAIKIETERIKKEKGAFLSSRILEIIFSEDLIEIEVEETAEWSKEDKKNIMNIIRRSIYLSMAEDVRIYEYMSEIEKSILQTEHYDNRQKKNIQNIIEYLMDSPFGIDSFDYRICSSWSGTSEARHTTTQNKYKISTESIEDTEEFKEFMQFTSDKLDRIVYGIVYSEIISRNILNEIDMIDTVNEIGTYTLDELYSKTDSGTGSIALIDYGMKMVYEKREEFKKVLKDMHRSDRRNLIIKRDNYNLSEKDLKVFLSVIKHREDIINGLSAYITTSYIVGLIGSICNGIIETEDRVEIDQKDLLKTIEDNCDNLIKICKREETKSKYKELEEKYAEIFSQHKNQANPLEHTYYADNSTEVYSIFNTRQNNSHFTDYLAKVKRSYFMFILYESLLEEYKKSHLLNTAQRKYIQNKLEKDFLFSTCRKAREKYLKRQLEKNQQNISEYQNILWPFLGLSRVKIGLACAILFVAGVVCLSALSTAGIEWYIAYQNRVKLEKNNFQDRILSLKR